MKSKRLFGLVSLLSLALMALACDASSLVALVNPATETPTRTPRPTFTPRPVVTETPEDTPTPEVTDTPSASPTATKRAVVATVRPAATKPPAPPPPPQFAWRVLSNDGSHGFCATGAPTFQVKGRVFSGTDYLGGVHVVLLDKDSKIVTQGDSWGREQMNLEFGVSCFDRSSLFNYQLDGSAGWFNGPLILRLTKSASDQTPISPNVPITWDASGGRYYIDFVQ
ncbi:MAG TPA: hypothetical protein VF429_02235 [Anaerolineae bacterium]